MCVIFRLGAAFLSLTSVFFLGSLYQYFDAQLPLRYQAVIDARCFARLRRTRGLALSLRRAQPAAGIRAKWARVKQQKAAQQEEQLHSIGWWTSVASSSLSTPSASDSTSLGPARLRDDHQTDGGSSSSQNHESRTREDGGGRSLADELLLRMGAAANGGFLRGEVGLVKDGLKQLPHALARGGTGGGGGATPMMGMPNMGAH